MSSITLPHQFNPRPYQLPLFQAFDSGFTRGICIEHRRAGKDKKAINLMAKKMLERVGFYPYFFPTYRQAKKVLWNGMDRNGFKFMDHIPQELRKRTNDTDLLIELVNGSIIQLLGTDNPDSWRGINPVGAVFSEFSWQNPAAWDTVRPILNENGGWALFLTTPLGKNHAYRLYMAAKQNPKWFTQFLTIENTKREDGRAVITMEDIDEERKMGMAEDMIQQEYFCSFDASMKGAYYADQIVQARKQDRTCSVPWEEQLLVHTAWDMGFDDAMSTIFYQTVGKEIHIIDYEEHSGEGLAFYASMLRDKGYKYGTHFLPHDAAAKRLEGGGKSIEEQLQALGVTNTTVVPVSPITDGIQRTRTLFPRFWIHSKGDRMERLIDAISQYHKEWDEERGIFKSHPEHDWTSHPCDALRTLSMGFEEQVQTQPDYQYQDYSAGALA